MVAVFVDPTGGVYVRKSAAPRGPNAFQPIADFKVDLMNTWTPSFAAFALMKPMTLLSLLAAVLSVFCWENTTSAGIIASHQVENDPTTEGFTFSNNGDMMGTVGPVFNDGISNLNAWMTDDDGTNSNLSYIRQLAPGEITALGTHGWSMEARLRVVDVNDPDDFGTTIQYENGANAFLLRFSSDANGDPRVVLNGTALSHTIVGGAGDYHLYELLDDDMDGDADLYVDGVLRFSDYGGIASVRTLFAFGDTSTTPGSGGQGNWNLASLSTIPEPSTFLLAGLSACFLGIRDRRRRTKSAAPR